MKIKNILFYIILFFTILNLIQYYSLSTVNGVTTSNNLTNVNNSSIPYRIIDQLDEFLELIKLKEKDFSSDENYIKLLDNIILKLEGRKEKYINREKMQEVLIYLSNGIEKIKNDFLEDLSNNNTSENDSPFGICRPHFNAFKFEGKTDNEVNQMRTDFINKASDLGFKWTRIDLTFTSQREIMRNGDLNFDELDNLVELYQDVGFNILMLVGPHDMTTHHGSRGIDYIPKDLKEYKEYVSALVERYNFDGNNDMPGLKYGIKYWEIDNEVDGNGRGVSVDDYCTVFKITSQEITSVDEDAVILFAGLTQGGKNFYPEFKEKCSNGEDYFDVVNWHLYPSRMSFTETNERIFEYISVSNSSFSGKDIWVTESSIPSEDTDALQPNNTDKPPILYLDEKSQAGMLVKMYVSFTANGIDKTFWWSLIDKELIGTIIDDFNKNNLCNYDESIKLSGYSAEFLIEKLENSDWNNISIIQEENGIYIYEFINKTTNHSTWIAWSENGSEDLSLDLLGIENAKITQSVPDYESGYEIQSDNISFDEMFEEYIVSNSFEIGNTPIFIEEE